MIYAFGDYALDTGNFELRRDGIAVAVEPQVFNLLHVLIENRDRVVSRRELIDAVWGGRIISGATLSSRVSAARRAVGDTGGIQSVIRTVPRRGFRFVAAASSLPATAAAAGNGDAAVDPRMPCMPSVAVLPFRNINLAEGEEFSTDGLTEDLITELSRFRDIRVVSTNATRRHDDHPADPVRVGRELGARYLVEGSVRRAGPRYRISAQLIDSGSGLTLWADRYEPALENVFVLQDEIPRALAAALSARVQDAALERALRKSPSELDAFDCILRARPFRTRLDNSSHAEARDLLERAVRLDPGSADAHALLANVYLAEHRLGLNPRPDPVGRALNMAEAAVQLDPQNAYARCWLGIVHFFRGENERFETETARALALNPNDPEILADIGHYQAFLGEFSRGTELTRRAQRLNPLHPGWYHFGFAREHFSDGAYDAVLSDVQHIGMPEFYWTHLLNAAAFGQMGDIRAAESLARVFRLRPNFNARAELRKWNAAPDDEAHILDGLGRAGLRD